MRALSILVTTLGIAAGTASGQIKSLALGLNCDDINSGLCTERQDNINYEGNYIGHDEPALLFYSNGHRSGSAMIWRVVLPIDPITFPNQQGTGSTWNFQLHPAFWVGMAICDSQSFPEFTTVCKAAGPASPLRSIARSQRETRWKWPASSRR
jgi:hypothetical protein